VILHKSVNIVIGKNIKSLNMSKKVVLVSVLALVVLFLVSCNTYQRCPAYGAAEVEAISPNKV